MTTPVPAEFSARGALAIGGSLSLVLNERAHLSVDVANLAIDDQERLLDVCAHPAPGQRRLGDHIELGTHPVAVDVELGRCTRLDDPKLRTTIQAAPQVVSGESGLDAILDPNAVRRERDVIATVVGQ